MFTPAFANDADLAQNTTSKVVTRKKSELFTALQEMPVGELWHEVDANAFPDANKFRISVYRHAKNGAGKFKVKSTPEGTFIKKIG